MKKYQENMRKRDANKYFQAAEHFLNNFRNA